MLELPSSVNQQELQSISTRRLQSDCLPEPWGSRKHVTPVLLTPDVFCCNLMDGVCWAKSHACDCWPAGSVKQGVQTAAQAKLAQPQHLVAATGAMPASAVLPPRPGEPSSSLLFDVSSKRSSTVKAIKWSGRKR